MLLSNEEIKIVEPVSVQRKGSPEFEMTEAEYDKIKQIEIMEGLRRK